MVTLATVAPLRAFAQADADQTDSYRSHFNLNYSSNSLTLDLLVICLLLIGLVIYFLPTFIGWRRNIATKVSLLAVNVLFGWTLVGWVVCLIWAASSTARARDGLQPTRASPNGTPLA